MSIFYLFLYISEEEFAIYSCFGKGESPGAVVDLDISKRFQDGNGFLSMLMINDLSGFFFAQ